VTEGLARRDVIALRQVKVAELQSRLDGLAQQRRKLDNRLQEHNWQATLLE